jgi:GxxExxY protein
VDDRARDPVSHVVIGAAIAVHRGLGPGLLESVYESCLSHEFRKRGIRFERAVHLPVRYDGIPMDNFFRLDLVVEYTLVVELKSVSELLPVHRAQLLTYLRLGGFPRGLLINFNVRRLAEGIVRMAN